jgi:hypothetical protein
VKPFVWPVVLISGEPSIVKTQAGTWPAMLMLRRLSPWQPLVCHVPVPGRIWSVRRSLSDLSMDMTGSALAVDLPRGTGISVITALTRRPFPVSHLRMFLLGSGIPHFAIVVIVRKDSIH